MANPRDNNIETPFFSHRTCPYFPCHEGIDPDEFNCLFCFCPLYMLGTECGGNFTLNKRGVKDCTSCYLPHLRGEGARMVTDRFSDVCASSALLQRALTGNDWE